MNITKENYKEHVYTSYPRNFLTYRWYKPIIAFIIFAILYLLLIVVSYLAGGVIFGATADELNEFMKSAAGGYDTLDITTVAGVVTNLGTVALMIPAIMITALIVHDRPFSSYSSSRGGWSTAVLFKCLLVALPVVAIPIIVDAVIFGGDFNYGFTTYGLIALTLIGPLQCIAEEYVFRGLAMQTFGSWFRVPVIAVVLQAAVFASMHPYSIEGVVEIFISGMIMGICAWQGRGLEVSSALHIVNNMTLFYLTGVGMNRIQTQTTWTATIEASVIDLVYCILVLYIGKKNGWFDKIKKDDVAKFNAKVQAKIDKKVAKLEAKQGKTVKQEADQPKHMAK